MNKCTERTDFHLTEKTRRERADSSLWKARRKKAQEMIRAFKNLYNE